MLERLGSNVETVEATKYEIRCYRCDTSFAPGTRQCVHCGHRLGRTPPLEVFGPELQTPGGEEELELRTTPARGVIWIVSALVALAGSMLRMCQPG